ncbi:MAG: hypothetical protein K1X56_09115 [Flavobacteriales bacterium]|nr:hypothetical protein [Flavobacteriales bacterium]
MSRLEFTRQRLIGMINRISTIDELQEIIDSLYLKEQEKEREEKERKKEEQKKSK